MTEVHRREQGSPPKIKACRFKSKGMRRPVHPAVPVLLGRSMCHAAHPCFALQSRAICSAVMAVRCACRRAFSSASAVAVALSSSCSLLRAGRYKASAAALPQRNGKRCSWLCEVHTCSACPLFLQLGQRV